MADRIKSSCNGIIMHPYGVKLRRIYFRFNFVRRG